MKKAIILLSGGIDSTVVLALAIKNGLECHALSFDYGQRHKIELKSAKAVAAHYDVPHKIIQIDPISFGKSSLVTELAVPLGRTQEEIGRNGIPNTYVPARNTLFLAYALGQAEMLEAHEIHAGFNALDGSPYPDCRPAFVAAFQGLINVATKQSVEGNPPLLIAPLISWDKQEIIRQGVTLKAPLHMTFSCYNPTSEDKPCTQCDACILRNLDSKS